MKKLFLFFLFVPLLAFAEAKENPSLIIVSGQAETKIEPDEAYISFKVETREDEIKQAIRKNNQIVAELVKKLQSQGDIEANDIRTEMINIMPIYKVADKRQEIDYYQVSNSVHVKISDINEIGNIASLALRAGVTHIFNLRFGSSKSEEIRNKVLLEAVMNAKKKAGLIAKEMKLKLGKPHMISTEGANITPPPMPYMRRGGGIMESSFKAGGIPVSPGQLTVNSQVNISFTIE